MRLSFKTQNGWSGDLGYSNPLIRTDLEMDKAEDWAFVDHHSSLWLSAHFSNFFLPFWLAIWFWVFFPGKTSFSIFYVISQPYEDIGCPPYSSLLWCEATCTSWKYTHHLWQHNPFCPVIIIKYHNQIHLLGKKLHMGQSFIHSEENQTNQPSTAHFINWTNEVF